MNAYKCLEHDPNDGPGSDWCRNCGEFAVTNPKEEVAAILFGRVDDETFERVMRVVAACLP